MTEKKINTTGQKSKLKLFNLNRVKQERILSLILTLLIDVKTKMVNLYLPLLKGVS